MSGTEAIGALDDLMGGLNKRVNALHEASHEATVRWDSLSRFGGQRDDHAAALLNEVRQHLQRIATYAERCVRQLEAIEAKPFGE